MNANTPRLFVAATRRNDGKTTVALGLLAALQRHFPRVGYIKPVGQRFVEIEAQKIDEDTVLMDRVYRLNCPLVDMSPLAVEADFTRNYLQDSNNEALVKRVQGAFDRVAWEKDFVLIEGSGHAGVGAVFDLSNAQAAKVLRAKVVIVTTGGIGKPIDEVALNQALFEKEGVEIVGVIINKVLRKKIDLITDYAQRGLRRKGLELLGVVPHEGLLSNPTLDVIREELRTETLNHSPHVHELIADIVLGDMGVQNLSRGLKTGALLVTPGDREDLVLAVATAQGTDARPMLSGLILTGGTRPRPSVLEVIQRLPFPVLLAQQDSYEVAAKIHDVTVKTRPEDQEKIALIRNLVTQHIDLPKLLSKL